MAGIFNAVANAGHIVTSVGYVVVGAPGQIRRLPDWWRSIQILTPSRQISVGPHRPGLVMQLSAAHTPLTQTWPAAHSFPPAVQGWPF